jgi:hypothetical protein
VLNNINNQLKTINMKNLNLSFKELQKELTLEQKIKLTKYFIGAIKYRMKVKYNENVTVSNGNGFLCLLLAYKLAKKHTLGYCGTYIFGVYEHRTSHYLGHIETKTLFPELFKLITPKPLFSLESRLELSYKLLDTLTK